MGPDTRARHRAARDRYELGRDEDPDPADVDDAEDLEDDDELEDDEDDEDDDDKEDLGDGV